MQTQRALLGREKLFMPTFSIGQLRSSRVMDFGAGNFSSFKRAADVLTSRGIRGVCVLPITETDPSDASNFGRVSSNALSYRNLDLREVPELKGDSLLQSEMINAQKLLNGPRQNLALVETIHLRYLQLGFKRFLESRSSARNEEFSLFCKKHAWWLDAYSDFKTQGQDSGVMGDRRFYQYVQMETYRQAEEAFEYAHSKGIEEIELLIGVGVSRNSAEGSFMNTIFDPKRQIGCFPEPENGYPLQLWAFLAEIMSPELLEFKAKSFLNMQNLGVDRVGIDHACGFLGGYTTFPVFGKDGRVFDANIPKDAEEAETGGKWEIEPGDEERRLEYARSVLSGILELVPGMKLTAETVGDNWRRVAAEKAIAKAIAAGKDITLMRALPWDDRPLSDYKETDRLTLSHDMPPLITLLTGMAGSEKREWINGGFVGKLLNRLGVLAPALGKPMSMSQISSEFMVEILRRISSGSEAGTVVTPLSTLFNLHPDHMDHGLWQFINIMPGTAATIGNESGNWEKRLPPIEKLEDVGDKIEIAANRESRAFGKVISLDSLEQDHNFSAQIAKVEKTSVAYQAADGNWTVWEHPEDDKPLFEFAVTYTGDGSDKNYEDKSWANYDLSQFGIKSEATYTFYDLITRQVTQADGSSLRANGFLVGLNPENRRHHFVVYEWRQAS